MIDALAANSVCSLSQISEGGSGQKGGPEAWDIIIVLLNRAEVAAAPAAPAEA